MQISAQMGDDVLKVGGAVPLIDLYVAQHFLCSKMSRQRQLLRL
jgi:hypothetical protein